MNLLIIGAPGTGKGTMSALIKKTYNVAHVSTGDILRENIKNETEFGKKAKEYIENGELVPDEIIHDIILDRLSKDDVKHGFLFDGYPRTLAQAKDLDVILDKLKLKIDRVLDLNASDSTIEERITGRRICKDCKSIYHIKNMPSKVNGVCDKCGGELYQRDDDTLEALSHRLNSYHKQTQPVIDYYKDKGLVSVIDSNRDSELVFEDIKQILGELK